MKNNLPAIKQSSEVVLSKASALLDAAIQILSKGSFTKTTERALTRNGFPSIYFESIDTLRLRGEVGYDKDGSGPGLWFDGCLHLSICGEIYLIGDLIQKTEKELLSIIRVPPWPAKELVRQIKWKLADLDLELGTVIENWPPADLMSEE